MSDRYILDADGNPVPCDDLLAWGRWLETSSSRRVAFTQVTADISVSTVFLGLNHRYSVGPPLLFETMIFGGPQDQYQDRYTTRADAIAGHEKAVALALESADV